MTKMCQLAFVKVSAANADSHYNCQILHFRSERRVVLFILSGHVSEAPFLPFQSQSNAIEIRFFFSFPILSMPFNSNTPFIYLISWFLQSAAIFSIMVFITPTMCWLVGTCLLFTWLIEDITSELARLNPITSSNQHERDLKRQFFKIIQLHSDVRQLSAMQFSEHFFLNFCDSKLKENAFPSLDSSMNLTRLRNS